MDTKLLPCPFCNVELSVERGIFAYHPPCADKPCFFDGLGFGIDTSEWARWNDRSPTALAPASTAPDVSQEAQTINAQYHREQAAGAPQEQLDALKERMREAEGDPAKIEALYEEFRRGI